MARPKSDEKRSAILMAAAHVIVKEGLGAPTATIAREAGVANGTVFTYFETKADLFNQVYLELKSETAAAAMADVPPRASFRTQFFHVWSNWTHFAAAHPHKRRALALLGVSEDITKATHAQAHQAMADLGGLFERSRASGPLRDAPAAFVMSLMNSVAEATIDMMVHDRKHAEAHCKMGYDALWRMVG